MNEKKRILAFTRIEEQDPDTLKLFLSNNEELIVSMNPLDNHPDYTTSCFLNNPNSPLPPKTFNEIIEQINLSRKGYIIFEDAMVIIRKQRVEIVLYKEKDQKRKEFSKNF